MKICIATGTRAEYGLLKPLMDEILRLPDWELELLVTGAHLSPEFGLTVRQIEADGLQVGAKVEMLLSSDTAAGIVKSMGIGMIGYADALTHIRPDIMIVLGDRYEMLSVAAAALIYKIPIAHIHGGEVTEGAYDDAMRHAITKMSFLHFPSTDAYRNRIIQMGESPDRVFNVGAPGLDNIKAMQLLSRAELEKELGIHLCKQMFLITYHPVTLTEMDAGTQFQRLLHALEEFQNTTFIFTKANADTDGRIINQMIDGFVATHRNHAIAFTSMGQLRYLSAMQHATLVLGNSSSGIIEAPAFGVPTVNIGDRQKGRVRAASIIDCDNEITAISEAIRLATEEAFRSKIHVGDHPYGNGTASQQIVSVLQKFEGRLRLQKKFIDLK